MNKIILATTTLITAFIIASTLSSCKHLSLRSDSGQGPVENNISAPVKFLSIGLVLSTGKKIKQLLTAAALISTEENNDEDETIEPATIPLFNTRQSKKVSLTVSYSTVNRNSQSNVLKTQSWIICKPQFIRVRPEGVDHEKDIIGTLF